MSLGQNSGIETADLTSHKPCKGLWDCWSSLWVSWTGSWTLESTNHEPWTGLWDCESRSWVNWTGPWSATSTGCEPWTVGLGAGLQSQLAMSHGKDMSLWKKLMGKLDKWTMYYWAFWPWAMDRTVGLWRWLTITATFSLLVLDEWPSWSSCQIR